MASPFIELEVGGRTVKVTNPDKVLFPAAGHTKRDLVDYYIAVGDGIVRALRERPTQLRRFPDGIEGEQIYQKRVPEKRPEWVEAARVTFPSGRHADELCVTELAQVVWVYTPFNKAIAPGKKAFDFDINQISYTPERANVLAFSAATPASSVS